MDRVDILNDIRETLGIVPKFFEGLPDATLEYEWGIFKGLELAGTALPNKYKELIGLGVASALHCRYCTLFHTEAARMQGASDEEVNEALLMAKHTAGWSTYLNGCQYDFDLFKSEVQQVQQHLAEKSEQREEVGIGM